ATVVKLNYAPRKTEETPAAPAPGPGAAAPAPTTPAPKPVPPGAPGNPIVTTPAAGTPVTTPPAPADTTPPPPPPAPTAATPATTPPATPVVSFTPPMQDVALSGAVTATLMLTNGQDIFEAPMQIQYDPKVLRLNDVVRGGLMANDGQQVVFTKNIMND